MEPIRILLPQIWAEKNLAPLLREAHAADGSLMCHVGRVEFDANAPDNSNSGLLQLVLCVVPKKSAQRLRELILTERGKLEAQAAKERAKNATPYSPTLPSDTTPHTT